MKIKKKIARIMYHTILISVGFIMIYPLLWMIGSAFKPSHEIMVTAEELIPGNPTLDNFINGWKGFGRDTYALYFKNTLIFTLSRVIGASISCTLVAFSFARIRFTGSRKLFLVMISTMCIPSFLTDVPIYIMYSKLGLVGTRVPLLLTGWFGGPYHIFLLMQFMRGIPRQIDEAAVMDGCGWIRLFAQIMVPLVRPAIAVVAVFAFIAGWSDYYSALIYLNQSKHYPVAYALTLYSGEHTTNYGPMLAMSVLSLIPVLITFFLFQKQLMDGIVTSGLKG